MRHYLKKPFDVFKSGDEISDHSEHSTIRETFEVDFQGNLPSKISFKKPRPLTCTNNRIRTFRSSKALIAPSSNIHDAAVTS